MKRLSNKLRVYLLCGGLATAVLVVFLYIAPEKHPGGTPPATQSKGNAEPIPASDRMSRAERITPSNFDQAHFVTMNELILEILTEMPGGGGYDASPGNTSAISP